MPWRNAREAALVLDNDLAMDLGRAAGQVAAGIDACKSYCSIPAT
jgi:hypothetical protein